MTDPLDALEQLGNLTDLQALAAGRLPAGRAPLPHELRAGIRSAGRARAGLAAITAQTIPRLIGTRIGLLVAIRTYADQVLAAHPHAAGTDARALLLALGGPRVPLIALPGLAALIDDATAFHHAALRDAARLGALHVRAEARAQGIRLPGRPVAMADPPPPPPRGFHPTVPDDGAAAGAALDAELAARAQHAAESPLVDVAGELRDIALGMSASGSYDDVLGLVLGAGTNLSTAGLETDFGDALAQQAWGLGRSDGADELAAGGLGEPVQTYASEIDDKNTCGPCFDIDGTVFPTRAEGERAYAGGVYEACRGGGRCRGTLVYIWGAESPATVG